MPRRPFGGFAAIDKAIDEWERKHGKKRTRAEAMTDVYKRCQAAKELDAVEELDFDDEGGSSGEHFKYLGRYYRGEGE